MPVGGLFDAVGVVFPPHLRHLIPELFKRRARDRGDPLSVDTEARARPQPLGGQPLRRPVGGSSELRRSYRYARTFIKYLLILGVVPSMTGPCSDRYAQCYWLIRVTPKISTFSHPLGIPSFTRRVRPPAGAAASSW